MTSASQSGERVESIPVSQIQILNPRSRNKRVHGELIESIRAVGLKRPITVTRRTLTDGTHRYDLICGQGRLEACLALHQSEIPAFVTDASEEDCLVMSLVENVARRQHRPIDLMREIGALRERGNDDSEIARKIGVTTSWVKMIIGLLDRGEEKLLAAVETGLIPVSMATDIARSSDGEIQNLLADAYENGFRGKKLTTLRRLLERRAKRDKLVRANPMGSTSKNRKKHLNAADLRRLLEREAERQRLSVKKAEFTHDRLVFATQALKELFSVPEFGNIMRMEQLDSLPKLLQSRMQSGERA